MTGRNAPCPCGSGKKSKRCCAGENDVAKAPARDAASAAAPVGLELEQLLALANAGEFARLEAAAAACVRRHPSSAPMWKLLGLSLWRQGKDPLHALQAAVRCSPNDAEAASNLGNALHAAGRLEEALAAQRRALTLAPGYALAHNNLGSVLQALGRWQPAAECYRAAAAHDPAFVQAHCNLGNALLELARPAEAAASYRRALQMQPDLLAALVPLGAALRDVGELGAAAAAFERALALKPAAAELHYNLAVVLRLQNRSDEADAAVRAALDLNPSLVAALVLSSRLAMDRGRFAEAEILLQRAIAIEPESPQAWSAIPALRRMTPRDTEWRTTAERIAAGPLPARREVQLRYALGKYFDDVQDFPRAFHNYRRANELTKTYAPPHSRAQVTETVGRIMQIPLPVGPQRRATDGARQTPVFIIGMPRSGTSLVEQILASHPAVYGAGELAFWGDALRGRLAGAAGAGAAPASLAHGYRELLQRLAGPATCVVDKMPSNFLAAGLIHEALPDARFIHMQRDPVDTCLSLYFQDFESAYAYANDLDDLAHSYREYLRIMDHWRAGLAAGALLEVRYEQLVADQEHWTRRLLDFVGLPFDPACMDFQRTVRAVTTVSSWQVRQAIHTGSVERWRNYREFIGPLSSLVDAAAMAAKAASRSLQ